ncbi:MAG: SusC/RagA family TonB-linked outer membrane protein [Tannerellaceae bacterium]|jgi:TonB-linked SusC/RagA family outer membrane protein|nr:SusC/RagA family TonB-linked outer membrane protein [Tannerellaceae bacterium]
MRIALLLLFVIALQAGANSLYSQSAKVSLEMNNATVEEILNTIEEESEFYFLYNSKLVDVDRKVSVNVKSQSVETVLDQLFASTDVTYKIEDRQIILSKKEFAGNELQQNKKTVSGVIVDNQGEPVIGASIVESGTTNGVISDVDGKFSISVSQDAMLQVSYIGYAAQTISTANQTSLQIVLLEDTQVLDEVVVVGYGTVRKKDLTGAVIQVRPDRLANENPQTIQDVLRGTAGLNVGMSNDAKGGGSLNIRGQRSVYTDGGHNDPLLILDGMQFYGELSEINPDDIEQIDILKDASSAAIYGAKAANGVIIITSKKGKSGKPVVNFTGSLGLTTRADYERYFTADEYLQHKVDYYESNTFGVNSAGQWSPYQTGSIANRPYYYTNYKNLPESISLDQWRGYTQNAAGESDESIWARRINFHDELLDNYLAGMYVNWEDYVYRTGIQQDYNISVGGASDKANYYLSAGYLDNQGVRNGNDYSTVRVNMKLNMDVTKWFSIGANVNFQDRTDGDNYNPEGMRGNAPWANRYDENGDLAQYTLPSYSMRGNASDFNARYQELEKGYTVFNTQFNAKVKLPFNITYQFNASPRYQFFYDRYFTSQELPDSNPVDRGVNREQSKRFDWSLNNTITWDQTFAEKHHAVVTLVQEAEERRFWKDRIEARDIQPSDALGFHNTENGNLENSKFSSEDTHETADALLARLQYTYDDRYLLTASVRRDGYCAFGGNNPYATFPSVALGWTFTNEEFWQWQHIMDYGKLRVSYGKNGNRSLANPYLALSNLTTGKYMGYIYNSTINDMTYLRVERLANPNLQWEKSQAWNIGLDFGFLNQRISGSIEYYNTQTKDMIMYQRLPQFIGFGGINTNLGQVDNNGFELTINSKNMDLPNFQWNTQFGFSYNKNRIVHLYGEYDENGKEMDDTSNGWFIGKSINEIWDYKVTGIWQKDQIEDAAKYGQKPGDPIVWNNPDNDINNEDGTTTIVYDNDDKQFLGKRTAPINWSLRNDFILFKNISVGFSIYSYMGHKQHREGTYDSDAFLNNDNGGGFLEYGMYNQPWKRYWTIDNPETMMGRINAVGPTGAEKPNLYLNRSFVRFDNLSIAYTLPKAWVEKLQVSNVKVHANVKNIGTIHSGDWYYGDPENIGVSTRTYTFGLNVTF